MPVTAKQLIEGRQPPATAKDTDSVVTALRVMIENDYSQLPVVDEGQVPRGLITADSILKAMDNFGVSADKLRVRDVATKHVTYTHEVNVFDLLDSLNSTPAVLLTDEDDRLAGIITNWDMAQYFRERSEDMMLVEDIETALKDHIRASFGSVSTADGEAELKQAIDKVANAPTISTVDLAIRKYVGLVAGKQKPDAEALTKVREGFLKDGKSLGDMTLYQLMELMLYPSRWKHYQSNFTIDDQALRTMLEKVQDIRNTLAHFKDELTPLQRESLRFCAGWFNRNPAPTLDGDPVESVLVTDTGFDGIESAEDPRVRANDGDPESSRSRYARLASFLQQQSASRVQLTLDTVEVILGSPLPPSARSHRSWWANDATSHVQSRQWLDAGWRVAGVNLTDGVITFARTAERERMYIDFFGELLARYAQIADYPIKTGSPSGASWITVGTFRENGAQVASLGFAFTREGLFRVELYIDAGNRELNKQFFDALSIHQKDFYLRLYDALKKSEHSAIVHDLVEGMWDSWERLDHRRACRVAFVHPGAITNSSDFLSSLLDWGAAAMVEFQHLLTPLLAEMGYAYSDK